MRRESACVLGDGGGTVSASIPQLPQSPASLRATSHLLIFPSRCAGSLGLIAWSPPAGLQNKVATNLAFRGRAQRAPGFLRPRRVSRLKFSASPTLTRGSSLLH